ncbi:MAG: signal peptidase I [Peptostreptococcaceae bacterium]
MSIKIEKKPSCIEIEAELNRVKKQDEYNKTLKSTIYILIIVASIAVLVSVLYLPVLSVQGGSMSPALDNGQVLIATRSKNIKRGDIIAFNYNNKVLLKRVIATQGEVVNIKEDGTVYVNGEMLEEEYIAKKSLGEVTIDLPYQVEDGKFFVMGDHRETSIDSRSNSIGTINKEQILGKVFFRIWPMNQIGKID